MASCCRDKVARQIHRQLKAVGLDREATAFNRVMAADPWSDLPKGWTKESLKDMWDSLTGDRVHKISACIEKVGTAIDDAPSFCSSLARKLGYKPS